MFCTSPWYSEYLPKVSESVKEIWSRQEKLMDIQTDGWSDRPMDRSQDMIQPVF